MKKKLTLTLLLVPFLVAVVWALIDLWNAFHLVPLMFLVESPWLLAAALGSLNLYKDQPVRPARKRLLVTASFIGAGAFVYGALRNSPSALIVSLFVLVIAGMFSIVSFTPWLRQATSLDG